MPLENFGSILNYAEELEKQDLAFYRILTNNPVCADLKTVFEEFANDAMKNAKAIERIRRENVTEMILEPIKGFTRASFFEACENAEGLSATEALAIARRLEDRALRYYTEAADKIKAQPEVARALKTIGKKRKAHINKLASL